MNMKGHEGPGVREESVRKAGTQKAQVKTFANKPVASKIDYPQSKMPLRKKVIRKTPARNKAINNETKKRMQECSKDRFNDSESNESSSDDQYLEDYSTGDSENDVSDSDDLSQEFSDEDKLMEYYERKLREHCLVANVGSCSTDSNANDESPAERLSSNMSLKTDVGNKLNPSKDSKARSQTKVVDKTAKRTKPGHQKKMNSKSLLTVPSITRMNRPSECSPARTGKLENFRFNDDNSSCDIVSNTADTGPGFGEPSSSNLAEPMFGPERVGKSSSSVNKDDYDSNKKVIDYLNRMESSGPSGERGIRNKEKASYKNIVDEIHNSAKAHILKNYVSSFARKQDFGSRKSNVRKHQCSSNYSTSESGKSEEEVTKDEIVDRILSATVKGNAEKNLTNSLELWKRTLSQ